MEKETLKALKDSIWVNHKISDVYTMANTNGKQDFGCKIAYYPIFGTYKNEVYVPFDSPQALVEKLLDGGIDFREIPLHFLIKQGVSIEINYTENQ